MTPTAFLTKFRIDCFFHFTDQRNFDLIRSHGGLLSLRALQARDIQPPAPGGNDWSHEADRRVGLDEYVHLCLLNEHPMEYRARQEGRLASTRFLRIDPSVLGIEGACFTSDVSNKARVPKLSLIQAIEAMDFSVIYERHDWRDPAVQARRQIAKKYELLIPNTVPLDLIRGI